MKIAMDSWTLASRFRCQGTYVYAQNLIREFKKLAREDVHFALFASARKGNDAAGIAPEANLALHDSRLLDHDRLWRFGGASVSALRARADVMFLPTAATLPAGTVPAVCNIHDVTPVTMPSHGGKIGAVQRLVMKGCARFSRTIITPSECSKRDIVELLGVPEAKVVVVHDGCDHTIFNGEPVDPGALKALCARLRITKNYVLHHGTIQPRKNLKRLIDAYRLMVSRNAEADVELVLVGQFGWASEEVIEAAGNDGDRGRIILAGMLPDNELAILIKGASLVVMPSLYEGFCMPMVEAMACGVPTVASRSSCLPEISGNTLEYFDPLIIEEMAACMQSVLLDKDLNRRIRHDGMERASEFSWERCACETLDVLIKAANAA